MSLDPYDWLFCAGDSIDTQEESSASELAWTQKDGTQILVSKMTTRHIVNCLNMLKRNHSSIARKWIAKFKKELKERKSRESIGNFSL